MKISHFVFVSFSLLTLVSCSGEKVPQNTASGGRLQVVTTIAPLYSMTLNVAGDLADVKNLVPVGASEHTYQARPSDIALLSDADLVIKNGVDLELFLDPLLASSERIGRVVVDTSADVPLLETEHNHGDHSSQEAGDSSSEALAKGDPHIWLNIENAKIQVRSIANALSAKDSIHAVIFKENADKYILRLTALETDLKGRIASVEQKPYILFHDGFQYFEKEFGLHSSGVVEEFPGKEPSVEYMKELYDKIEKDQVKIAFTEPQFSPKVIEQLKARFNLITAELDTIGTSLAIDSYENLMKNNVESFQNAFSKAQ